jgi:hypothetical protein
MQQSELQHLLLMESTEVMMKSYVMTLALVTTTYHFFLHHPSLYHMIDQLYVNADSGSEGELSDGEIDDGRRTKNKKSNGSNGDDTSALQAELDSMVEQVNQANVARAAAEAKAKVGTHSFYFGTLMTNHYDMVDDDGNRKQKSAWINYKRWQKLQRLYLLSNMVLTNSSSLYSLSNMSVRMSVCVSGDQVRILQQHVDEQKEQLSEDDVALESLRKQNLIFASGGDASKIDLPRACMPHISFLRSAL